MSANRVETTPRQLAGEAFRRLPAAVLAAIHRGAENGARRGLAHVKSKTPVDNGQLRAAWKVRGGDGARRLASLENDAPYAGIVELGARPHPVSRAGIIAIWEWVYRHRAAMGFVTGSGRARGGLSVEKETLRIAYAIAAKIRREGQRPTYFVRRELPELGNLSLYEVTVALEAL